MDLILLDIVMEGLDGIGLCRRLKADRRLSHTPVIMLTAMGSNESLRHAFQAGAMDYITKPYREEELALRVRSALTLKAESYRRRAPVRLTSRTPPRSWRPLAAASCACSPTWTA
ncbi:hypothetical protein DFAR_3550007 [Desulfarculales bacterium]